MTYEEIQKSVLEDMKYNETNLMNKGLELAGRKQFWAGKLFEAKRELLKLESKKEEITKKVTEESENSEIPISARTAEQLLKNKNEKYKILLREIEEQKLMIEYLENVVKIYHNASFDIKNIIEMQKANNV